MAYGLWLIAVLAALSAPAAGEQTRDTRGLARGTGVISGVVVSDDADARPVRKARVTCGSPDVSGSTTMTDDAGRFVFAGLPAGRYTVSASKASWVTMSYGARRPLRPGSAIPLKDAQKIDIVIRMARGGVITGVVLDFNNQPAAGTTIRAMRYAIVSGERRLDPAGQSTADDRGSYRIYGLLHVPQPAGRRVRGDGGGGRGAGRVVRSGVPATRRAGGDEGCCG